MKKLFSVLLSMVVFSFAAQAQPAEAPKMSVRSFALAENDNTAKVSLDGSHVGETPCFIPKVLTGEHVVTVSAPGFRTVTKTVTVQEGKTEMVGVTLVKSSAAEPSSAKTSSAVEAFFGVSSPTSEPKNKKEAIDKFFEEEAIPFQLVEQKPSFNGGGINEFSQWVTKNLVYPEIAKENGIQGPARRSGLPANNAAAMLE